MGLGCFGQSVTAPLCCSFFLTFFPCCSVDPSCVLQIFRINLLLFGLSTGSSSFMKPPPVPAWGLLWLQCQYSHYHGLFTDCREISAPAWVLPTDYRGSLLGHLDCLFPIFPWCLQDCFSHFSPHCWAVFFPPLHRLSLRCWDRGCGAQPCPAVIQLTLDVTGCVWHGSAPASLHRGWNEPPCLCLGTHAQSNCHVIK